MSYRIGIVGNPDGVYAKLLRATADESGGRMVAQAFCWEDLAIAIPASLSFDDQTGDVDALIVRTMPLGSLEQVIFRMDWLQAAVSRGIEVVNPPQSLEIAIDKWLTLQRLSAIQIPIPATIACQSRSTAMQAWETLGGDTVVKPLFGGEGKGIIRVTSKDMAWRVFGTLEQLNSVLYVQQFHEHFGYDIRVLLIGDACFAVKRRAVENGWRTNLAHGAIAEPHELTEQQLELARRAATAIGGSVLGVDLLPCVDGETRVLEVNAVPGWKGLAQSLDLDVTSLVLNHVCDLVDKNRNERG